ncbi:hypothetical protein RRG08_036144 [Elysia crispata]|uniref:Uncharacterized protein n=1 Tax=Elysia crispata TaxID=231223 RepID=A0AAE0ZJ32_9GAST|nr:hypothetical protein RRG08_036144 [Elysia crispata]
MVISSRDRQCSLCDVAFKNDDVHDLVISRASRPWLRVLPPAAPCCPPCFVPRLRRSAAPPAAAAPVHPAPVHLATQPVPAGCSAGAQLIRAEFIPPFVSN